MDPVFADMSFETFAARHGERAGDHWFVEGDQAMTDADFRSLYEWLRTEASAAAPHTPVPVAATYAEEGFDAAWSSGRKLSLTWCVGRVMPSPSTNEEDHEAHYAHLVETVEWATRAWERAGDVNFIHLSEYDSPEAQASGACQPGENGIHFRVRTGPECTGPCGGKTYPKALPQYEFVDPDELDGDAEIVFGLQRFFSNVTEGRINALHELGHMIGFTHEHLRWIDEQEPNNLACSALGNIEWRGLTPNDPDSVMGVDSCVGVNNNLPRLSAWDRLGTYYQYTWGRRRASMMGVVSQVDDYAYDGTGQTGILWQSSRSAQIQRWTSARTPGNAIEFLVDELCANGGVPPCDGPYDSEGRVRPIPALLSGGASDLDVLFYGSGQVLEDAVAINDGTSLVPLNLDLDWFAVPVVGSFGSGNGDQILLYRPGAEQDALLVLDDGNVATYPMNFAGYGYPLAGRFRGFGGGRNDIVWYEPHSHGVSSWQWDHQDFEFAANSPFDGEALGLEQGMEYMPILGDFNGDALTDIFWYSAGDGADIMWWSQSDMDSIIFSAASAEVTHDYRPFVGDFDGNGTEDILWFAPYAEAVQVTSKIWYFTEQETYTSQTLSTRQDYSPYVADFDDDGCSDILWYKPDDPSMESPLWRCLPNERDFACEPPLVTPAAAYPVGFGGAY
ncbi:hypothetical protein DB30_00888 [Enhygromyxa salina]|uniref:FG-GAP repeat protein n=1 Tax=Enhygromyxa salina TaxID=215803 RepID=A0A0C2CYJ4_9BACT|nr:hypothetical protein DB30_00888 [Enhygromyxa salina]